MVREVVWLSVDLMTLVLLVVLIAQPSVWLLLLAGAWGVLAFRQARLAKRARRFRTAHGQSTQ